MTKIPVLFLLLALVPLVLLANANDGIVSSGETEGPCVSSCPGYRSGNPGQRDMTSCETGTGLGPVDHVTAFGFKEKDIPDWSSCGIPELPEANYRLCYKTVVDMCDTEYRIFLNKRNFIGLQRSCPLETQDLRSLTETEMRLQSPRYGCRKGRGSGKLYGYRRSDLCLYNVSIPSCESGRLLIESATDNDQELEARLRDENGNIICSDYLQFYYGNSSTQRYCGTELSLMLPLEIPATQFRAVFWTDPSVNRLGFKLTATCSTEQ